MFSTSHQSTRSHGFVRILSIGALALMLLGMIVAGCSGDTVSSMVVDSDEYLDALPDYPEPEPAYDGALDGLSFECGDEQVCSSTSYEIGDAPKEVVMFKTDPQVFWPGARNQPTSIVYRPF